VLGLEGHAPQAELKDERLLVQAFEQPRAEMSVHLDRSTDDVIGQVVELCWNVPVPHAHESAPRTPRLRVHISPSLARRFAFKLFSSPLLDPPRPEQQVARAVEHGVALFLVELHVGLVDIAVAELGPTPFDSTVRV